MGNRRACEEACASALASRFDVVVDRCNFDVPQRAMWLALARQAGAYPLAFHLDVPVAECVRRAQARAGHPTLHAGNAAGIIQGSAPCLCSGSLSP